LVHRKEGSPVVAVALLYDGTYRRFGEAEGKIFMLLDDVTGT
jgi:hypothetical protein